MHGSKSQILAVWGRSASLYQVNILKCTLFGSASRPPQFQACGGGQRQPARHGFRVWGLELGLSANAQV